MSELAELTGSTGKNDAVLPGYVISAWSLKEIGEAEKAFETDHLKRVADSAADATPAVREAMLEGAQSLVVLGAYNYGSSGFSMKMFSSHMLPLLLRLSLRKDQPQMTEAAAESLVTSENQAKITTAIREAAGFVAPKPKPSPNAGGAGTQSSGPAPQPETAL